MKYSVTKHLYSFYRLCLYSFHRFYRLSLWFNKRTSSSPSRESTSSPAAKSHRETNSLTRNDIPDIVAAVVQAMPNSNMTANVNSPVGGASLQSQPSNLGNTTNPTIQGVLVAEILMYLIIPIIP